jgi:hypothetical protein
MPGTPGRDGPSFLPTVVGNLLNPPTGFYYVVKHIHLANQDAVPRSAWMWLGASGASDASTALFEEKVVAANDIYDWHGKLKLTPSDFLTGGADAASALICTIDYDSHVLP